MDTFTVSFGDPGSPPPTREELEERKQILEEKIKRDARDIVEILRADFPYFIERAVKDRFLASDFADSLSDAKLKALKADTAATAKKAVSELVPSLQEWAIWSEFAGPVPQPSERKELRANAEVNARIQKIGGFLKDLLEQHSFPNVRDEEFRDAYRIPTRFIPPLGHAISHVESYWRNLEEYQAIRGALSSLEERGTRSKRGDRWDSI